MVDLFSLFAFAFVASITPGPNNIMLMASGARFGFARSVPHIGGILVGFPVMIIAIALGLDRIFKAYPTVHDMLKYVGAAYLLYLAYRVARAGGPHDVEAGARPLGFLGAALFQWSNPKAWAVALAVVPLYTTVGGNFAAELTAIILIFFAIGVVATIGWCMFGTVVARWLSTPRIASTFNIAMGLLLAASVIPMIL
ncbi:MAG: LysE family translocator [Hyphomicrobiales bacterium]|nr:LysE family translocator [Hyphomicrobiales bacterium]